MKLKLATGVVGWILVFGASTAMAQTSIPISSKEGCAQAVIQILAGAGSASTERLRRNANELAAFCLRIEAEVFRGPVSGSITVSSDGTFEGMVEAVAGAGISEGLRFVRPGSSDVVIPKSDPVQVLPGALGPVFRFLRVLDPDGSLSSSAAWTLYEQGRISNEPPNDMPRMRPIGFGDPCGEVVGGWRTLDGECDPILLDFGTPGFELSGVDDGVRFDIDADGELEEVSWTGRGARDAFLVLDRNGNGVIDDGGELFGNATWLADGMRAPNGYAVLAELDQPGNGGNGNGFIDRGDRVYRELRLWTDLNHDGVSDPIELTTLEVRGVVAIRAAARTSTAKDEHGNVFAFVSLAYVRTNRGLRPILTTDVFFMMREVAP